MNIRPNYRTVILGCLVLVRLLISQESTSLYSTDKIKLFGDHLFNEGDYLRAASEYERFLYLQGDNEDSSLFKIGLCFQFLEDHDRALTTFSRLENIAINIPDSLTRLAILYSHFKLENWKEIKTLSPINDTEFYFYYFAHAMNNDEPIDSSFFNSVARDSLRSRLWESEQKRNKLKNKSPRVAAVLSTLLPGSGKMYYGRSGDGLFSLIAVLFSGLASQMAFTEDREVTGLVTGAMALSFYLGTIYGSYLGAEIHNRELIRNWREDLNNNNPIEKKPYWESWL